MTTQQLHFISGMPRSGSTLLAGLLLQNPNFHAGMTSPVAGLLNSVLEQSGANSEHYSFFTSKKREAICRAIFQGYYEDQSDKPVIFDTNRTWTSRLHQLIRLYPDCKVICCVRNPAWIMDSFERLYRKNAFDYSRMYNANTRQTVYSRCEFLMNGGGQVGTAWASLKEAYFSEYADRLLLVDYDLLASSPAEVMASIYAFIGEAAYDHDFNNVEYTQGDFDTQIGIEGLHTVKRQVTHQPRKSILPPDVFHRFAEMDFWRDRSNSTANFVR